MSQVTTIINIFSYEKSEVHYSEFLLMFIKMSNGEQLYFNL